MTTSPREGGGSPLVRILGPVDVVVEGTAQRLGSRLERKLLAALALSANHAVSADRLSEILWAGAPPATSRNTLQTYVARLRRHLGGPMIVSEDCSYALFVARRQLDALVFDDLVSAAGSSRHDPERCRSTCREALSLWRGVPFGSFADEDPFRLEAIRLDEERMYVVGLMLESEVGLGNEERVVGDLEALVVECPYRERFWQLLVVALALCGRRVEALRAADECRALLAEVGLEPTPEMQVLEGRVLAQDRDARPRLRALLASLSDPDRADWAGLKSAP